MVSVAVSNASLRRAAVPAVFVAAMAASGCVGMAPTYGTGKPADQQLMEDVTSMFSLAPQRGEQIDYKPRPELVKPAPGQNLAALPAPQDDIKTASAGAWPESPEQRRARIRAEATEGRDDPDFVPEVSPGLDKNRRANFRATRGDDVDLNGNALNPEAQREEFNRRLAENNQGSPTSRKYLSEPPVEYRAPAGTAAADDVGEDEWKKDRRRKGGGTKSWWPF